MYHFFVTPAQIADGYAVITGQDVNHIRNVLRMKTGEQVGIRDGISRSYICELENIGGEEIRARILEEDTNLSELPAELYLFQGLPKSDKMELIIQKMTELGVYRIVPVSMKRSVVKLDKKKADSKVKRWNMISESAAKQSKRSIIPEIMPVCTFNEALEMSQQLDVKLLPYECADGMAKTKKIIENLKGNESIGIFIGPEGGYDLDELSKAKEEGWEEITLGKRILRTETAGMMLMSVLMYMNEK